MKHLVFTLTIAVLAAQGQPAFAKKCSDGKYRPVCATSVSGRNRPTILPNPNDYRGYEAAYRADLADFRRQIERERLNGTLNRSQFEAALNAQAVATKRLQSAKPQ